MELSILKLKSSRIRALHLGLHSNRFTFDHELAYGTSNPTSPHASSPPSPRWGNSMTEDDMCTIFEQHRAAVPFKWEETPGTPRGMLIVKDESSGAEREISSDTISPSSSSSGNSSSGDKAESGDSFVSDIALNKPDTEDFRFSLAEDLPSTNSGVAFSKHADELFSKGQLLPLKPPPRLTSIKHLMALEAEDRSFSFNSVTHQSLMGSTSPKKSRLSFRKDGLKALPFLASPRKDHHDDNMNIMLGFEDWPKLAHEHATGRRASVSFSFRKKRDEMDNDMDSILCGNSCKTGGRRPLMSVSSRGLADGYNFRNRFFPSYESDCDSDAEFESKNDCCDLSHTIPEEEEKDQQPDPKKTLKNLVAEDNSVRVKANRKRNALKRLSRFFRSSRYKPSRTSSVSPAPPLKTSVSTACSPGLGRNQGDLKTKRPQHQQQNTTRNPMLQMCLSNSVGQALIRNVKQIRSFEFHSHRSVAVK